MDYLEYSTLRIIHLHCSEYRCDVHGGCCFQLGIHRPSVEICLFFLFEQNEYLSDISYFEWHRALLCSRQLEMMAVTKAVSDTSVCPCPLRPGHGVTLSLFPRQGALKNVSSAYALLILQPWRQLRSH